MVGFMSAHRAPEPFDYTGPVRECSKCHRVQPFTSPHFHRDRTKRYGRDTWCSKCCDQHDRVRQARRGPLRAP